MASAYGRASDGDRRYEAFNKKDVNILILGETGVGKSTWINGIANYSKHTSLQDAMDDPEFTVLIPSRFVFTNKEGEGIDVTFGTDANEVFTSGQSTTQFPREYEFEINTTRFHLIDTPGVGDCRGIAKDKENLENILVFLTNYDKIHAVVVLLKPNISRSTVAFRFCVLELLTHLHKSLVSNIMFAFTNARGSIYEPEDSLSLLKKLLQEKNIGINLSSSNYFCFDNEAFRVLACHKRGFQFTPEEIDLYSKSWVESYNTTLKLLDLVLTMKPHETKRTMSLNEARNCIIAMSKPMGQAVRLNEQHKPYTDILVDKELEREIKELEDEKKFIYECASFFGVFLKENAMIAYNDSFSEYLDMLINDEQDKDTVIRDDKKIDQMKRDKQAYKAKKKDIVKMITSGSEDKNEVIPIVRIYEMRQKLCSLKHNGEIMKDALDSVISSRKKIPKRESFSQAPVDGFLVQYGKSRGECCSHDGKTYHGDLQDKIKTHAKERVMRDDKNIDQMKKDKETYEEKRKVIENSITSGSVNQNGGTLKDALVETNSKPLLTMDEVENVERQGIAGLIIKKTFQRKLTSSWSQRQSKVYAVLLDSS